MPRPSDSVFCAILCALAITADYAAADEPQWRSLIGEIDVRKDAHAGEWRKGRDVAEVSASERARITLPVATEGEYDFRVSFTRHSGSDSIALIFPVGGAQACFEVDACGENLAGIQNIGGKSIRDNPTKTTGVKLRNGQRYTITVEVRKGEVRGLLDGKIIVKHKTDGADLSMVEMWAIPQSDHLGLGAGKSATTFHSIEYRGAVKSASAAPAGEPATKSNPAPRSR